jgi:hypothetical protein
MIMHMALPVAPIILLPFIVLFFIIIFPLWVVAVAVLGALMGITRGMEWMLRAAGLGVERPLSGPVSNAFHWTLSWGGLAERRDRPRVE